MMPLWSCWREVSSSKSGFTITNDKIQRYYNDNMGGKATGTKWVQINKLSSVKSMNIMLSCWGGKIAESPVCFHNQNVKPFTNVIIIHHHHLHLLPPKLQDLQPPHVTPLLLSLLANMFCLSEHVFWWPLNMARVLFQYKNRPNAIKCSCFNNLIKDALGADLYELVIKEHPNMYSAEGMKTLCRTHSTRVAKLSFWVCGKLNPENNIYISMTAGVCR